ncbi:MAG: adenylosuccinate lyase [Oscillospiraceae bacterium]|nr:adenylosuccinate lyase [Oscillospiraceae bacterium]
MNDTYECPLVSRYAGPEMAYLFSPQKKISVWRRLWVALAKAQRKLGLNITAEQIKEMEAHTDDIDFEYAAAKEKEIRHDVMAHIHAFGKECPLAMPIIHLGATSSYVGDNTDIILMREGLTVIRAGLINTINRLALFAEKYKSLPTLGFTHFQPAQLTTVGKRACLWLNDFLTDLNETEYRISSLRLLGSKGATGTQAGFLELFDGDHEKVKKLDELISAEIGFEAGTVPVSGQTYSRKTDYLVLSLLSSVAQSAGKFATDMRLLAHLKELEEPIETGQVGSSAMPYKRNPMRCERICSLSRYIIALAQNPAMTAYNQWFERTLDDSANKRLSVPEAFLAADSILTVCLNVVSGIEVHEKVIKKHVVEELPFMATENILMRAVKKGGNRQLLHERIRIHSVAAAAAVKDMGLPNDLISRIAGDRMFNMTESEIQTELEPSAFTGRAAEQVSEFLGEHVRPVLNKYDDLIKYREPDLII